MESLKTQLVVQVEYGGKIPPQWITHINAKYGWSKYLLINLNSKGEITKQERITVTPKSFESEENLGSYNNQIVNAVIIGHGGNTSAPYFGLSLTEAGKLLEKLHELLCSLLVTELGNHNLRLQVCHAASPSTSENLLSKISKAVPSSWQISAPKYYSFISQGNVVDLPESIANYKIGSDANPMIDLNEIVKNGGSGENPSDAKQKFCKAINQEKIFDKAKNTEDRIQAIQKYSSKGDVTANTKGLRLL